MRLALQVHRVLGLGGRRLVPFLLGRPVRGSSHPFPQLGPPSRRLMPLLLGPPFWLVPKMGGLKRLVPV